MTLTKKDWPKLQWGIVLFVMLATAGACLAIFSNKVFNAASSAQQQARQTRDLARGKAAHVNEEAAILREKIAIYQTLQSHGIIGQEHRLDWIENIRKIREARKLLNLNYELGPQQVIEAGTGNAFDIMASPMKLQMSLLHEDDLLGLLSDLRSSVKGYLRVTHCDIERVSAVSSGAGPAPQLHANCAIDWITVREKS